MKECMALFMILPITFRDELFATIFTIVISLSCMNFHVLIKAALVLESLAAYFEWTLVGRKVAQLFLFIILNLLIQLSINRFNFNWSLHHSIIFKISNILFNLLWLRILHQTLILLSQSWFHWWIYLLSIVNIFDRFKHCSSSRLFQVSPMLI